MSPTSAAVASYRYVAFTTFRRNGSPVTTPVWVADLGDGTVGFTTAADSGKVARLGHTASVQLAPCTARGEVAPDAPTWEATARVARGADHARVRAAIARRYGWQLRAIDLAARLRRHRRAEVGVVVSFAPASTPPAASTGGAPPRG